MPTLKLDPAVASKLIDLLSTDDTFRALFVSNTMTALQQVGHTAPEDDLEAFVRDCASSIQLADKDVIASARAQINTMLTSGTSHIVPQLDAGYDGDRTLK
ncbi:putative modified peptide [Xanthomonas arboricola]|uniref:NHLP-related RiPP peptide n=1 Tax=Xanthomonas arboricola TaxID=56448 RepID=UPI0016148E11|nr:NHLP-related RiPP peptide [Xanthomonas arboricola]MBB3797280.1 putative modified peptide [Xanthomonas arboricola]